MQSQFPNFKAAAVQAAPVYLNRDATTDKVCNFIKEASRNGARLVVFPETFIPGYPHWVWLDSPGDEDRFFSQLVKTSVAIPSPTTEKLCQVASDCEIYVAIGVNESSSYSFAEIFNTLLLLGPNGKIIGKHRKIIPTYAEKLLWSFGDGSSLRTYDTELGKIGMLICGENCNSLARFALIAQAEQVHISNYPAFPQKGKYDLKKAIEIRAAAHSFEGKVFNIVSSSLIDKEMKRILGNTREKKEVLNNSGNGFTGVLGPNGELVAGPLADEEEGIVYADINLEDCIKWKLFHDISGNYNRFDILSLNINRQIRRPIKEAKKDEIQYSLDSDIMGMIKEKLNEIENHTLRNEIIDLIERLAAV